MQIAEAGRGVEQGHYYCPYLPDALSLFPIPISISASFSVSENFNPLSNARFFLSSSDLFTTAFSIFSLHPLAPNINDSVDLAMSSKGVRREWVCSSIPCYLVILFIFQNEIVCVCVVSFIFKLEQQQFVRLFRWTEEICK
jgi:hypothetical protein